MLPCGLLRPLPTRDPRRGLAWDREDTTIQKYGPVGGFFGFAAEARCADHWHPVHDFARPRNYTPIPCKRPDSFTCGR